MQLRIEWDRGQDAVAAALGLIRKSLKDDERVKKDRLAVKVVNRLEIALRK